jgi:plastocyanin
MNGTIIVQPAGTPYPHPQGYYTGQGNAEANAQLSAAQASIKLFPFANGGPMVAAGIDPKLMALPPSKSAVWRFLDADTLSTASQTVTIPVNSTITWVNETDNEPHTVTFPIPGHTPPPNLSPFAPPSGGNTYDGSHLVNSGPFGTAVGLPTNSFTLKFTKPGTFKYFCLFHDDFGMVGWVTVK